MCERELAALLPCLSRRHHGPSIIVNVAPDEKTIADALASLPAAGAVLHCGRGQSADGFMRCLQGPVLWKTPRPKQSRDVELAEPSS